MVKKLRTESGMTIVEISVAMSIIAVLIGVSLFAISAARRQGQITKTQGDMAVIEGKIEVVRAQKKKSLKDILDEPVAVTNNCNRGNISTATCNLVWVKLEITPTPIDAWGIPLGIVTNEENNPTLNCNKDWIISTGPNRSYDSTYTPGGVHTNGGDDLSYPIRPYLRACGG